MVYQEIAQFFNPQAEGMEVFEDVLNSIRSTSFKVASKRSKITQKNRNSNMADGICSKLVSQDQDINYIILGSFTNFAVFNSKGDLLIGYLPPNEELERILGIY